MNEEERVIAFKASFVITGAWEQDKIPSERELQDLVYEQITSGDASCICIDCDTVEEIDKRRPT